MSDVIETIRDHSGVDSRTDEERIRDDVTAFITRVGVRAAIKICLEKLQPGDEFDVDVCTGKGATESHLLTVLMNAGRRRGKLLHILQTAHFSPRSMKWSVLE